MKRFLIFLFMALLLFGVVAEGSMESAQIQKEYEAEEKGLLRVVKVYELGQLVEEFQGQYNLETNQYTGVITITENRGAEMIYIHKFWPSENTLIIIKEVTD